MLNFPCLSCPVNALCLLFKWSGFMINERLVWKFYVNMTTNDMFLWCVCVCVVLLKFYGLCHLLGSTAVCDDHYHFTQRQRCAIAAKAGSKVEVEDPENHRWTQDFDG